MSPWQDFRYAMRMLRNSPTFTWVAILTLALGIGANTAIFTVTNALLLRQLPYRDARGLVYIAPADPGQNAQTSVFSFPHFTFLREHQRSFAGLAAFTNESFNLTNRGDPVQVPSARVSAAFFEILGATPELGRGFLPEEDKPGGKLVAILSHRLWQERFGGQPSIIGQPITLDSQDYTVVGVLPATFQFETLSPKIDIWAPRVDSLNLATPQQVRSGVGYLNGVARLRSGVSLGQAQAEMDVLQQQYAQEFPGLPDSNPKLTMQVTDLREQMVSGLRPGLFMLSGAVGLLLMIACANAACLLLARALARKKEIAIRTALGARRGELLRQVLMESVLLSLTAGFLGVLVSLWTTPILSRAASGNLPRAAEMSLDWRVLAFGLGVSLLSGLLFGLVPAFQSSRIDLNAALRDDARGTIGGRRRHNLRNGLVMTQVALSIVLLVGSGLLIRSLVRLESLNPGCDPKGVLTMSMSLAPSRYSTPEQMAGFYRTVLERLRQLPGVETAAGSSALPVNAARFSAMLMEGQPVVPFPQRPVYPVEMITADYPRAMRIPLVRGRTFNEHDGAKAPSVALVNQALVRRYWPGQDPIGKHIFVGRRQQSTEVVGVIGDVRNVGLSTDPWPEVLLPFDQLPWAGMNIVIRSSMDPERVANSARQTIAQIDKDQPVTGVQTLEEVLASARAQPRLTTLLLGIFSAAALMLAIVGLYGSVSYSVSQRTREVGVRMALGATRADVLGLVVRQALLLTAAGILAGFVGSFALTRLLAGQLFGVQPTDPLSFLASAGLFLAFAALAGYLPARRAARIDPAVALRNE